MKKYPVSAFIVTLNEERFLETCLQSLDWVEEIILVDSGSTDRTLEIARAHGAKVCHNDWPGFAAQKQYALSLCSCDWVLNLDGDEALTPELTRRFQQIIEEGRYQAVRSQRADVFMGKPLPAICKKPNNLRFYRRELAEFNSEILVHETATVRTKELFVREHFMHYGYTSLSAIVNKANEYSSLRARQDDQRSKTPSPLKLLLVFHANLFKELIFQRKIFGGWRGFMLSMNKAHYSYLKTAKLYEIQREAGSPCAAGSRESR